MSGRNGRWIALRDDAFKTHFASVREDGWTVALDMLVEPDAGAGLGDGRCERGFADLKRIAPQIVAVQSMRSKAWRKITVVGAVVSDEIE